MFWDGVNPGEWKSEHRLQKGASPAERKQKVARSRADLLTSKVIKAQRRFECVMPSIGFEAQQSRSGACWTLFGAVGRADNARPLNQIIILIVGLQRKTKSKETEGAPKWMFRHRNEKPNHQKQAEPELKGSLGAISADGVQTHTSTGV